MTGIGAFGLSLGAFGVDLAPQDAFKGKIAGRKLKIAAIGCGGMGRAATESLISAGCDLVAICDIDPSMFDYWEKKYPGIPKFTDYRKMLKAMGDKFEAVQVGTPDHTHAYISIDCMNAGKHVYVQKPLARTVEECELMLKTSLRTRRVVQMGNQGHPGVWRYKALRDAGVWGEIKEIYSWSDRPIWPQGMKEYAKPEPIPAHFAPDSWDCWCGPSADHGYSSAYHRFKWRGWWDYGCGAIGKKSRIEMDFAANQWIPNGIKLVWTDGGIKPDMKSIAGLEAYAATYAASEEARKARKAKKEGKPYTAPARIDPLVPTNGLIVVGSKATTIGGSHAANPVCIAGDKDACAAALAKGNAAAKYSHYREFVEACLIGDLEKCGSKLSYAAPLTEALLIGCVALRYPGAELSFDAKKMCFSNNAAANAFLKAPKRGAWDFARL